MKYKTFTEAAQNIADDWVEYGIYNMPCPLPTIEEETKWFEDNKGFHHWNVPVQNPDKGFDLIGEEYIEKKYETRVCSYCSTSYKTQNFYRWCCNRCHSNWIALNKMAIMENHNRLTKLWKEKRRIKKVKGQLPLNLA